MTSCHSSRPVSSPTSQPGFQVFPFGLLHFRDAATFDARNLLRCDCGKFRIKPFSSPFIGSRASRSLCAACPLVAQASRTVRKTADADAGSPEHAAPRGAGPADPALTHLSEILSSPAPKGGRSGGSRGPMWVTDTDVPPCPKGEHSPEIFHEPKWHKAKKQLHELI